MTEISRDEIQQVLTYIDRIQEYEGQTRTKLFAVNDLLWAMLFIYAGIMDLVMQYLDPDWAVIPWALTTIAGISGSLYISNNRGLEVISDEVEKSYSIFSRLNKNLALLIISGWLFTTVLGFLGYIQFIMPWINIMVGTTIVGFVKYYTNTPLKMMLSPSSTLLFTATLAYLGAILNLTGYLLFSSPFVTYMGLITGLSIGLGFLNAALRRQI